MRIGRNSITATLLATALIAIALAPLANLSSVTCTLLIYFRFSLVIAATFLARFSSGRRAAWCFGFATFGWGSIVISVTGIWYGVNEVMIAPNLNLADLSRSVAIFVCQATDRSGRVIGGGAGGGMLPKVEGVVQFWFLILAGSTGGWRALILDRWKSKRPDSPNFIDSSNPR